MADNFKIPSVLYTVDELRSIRSSVDQYRLDLVKLIDHVKCLDLLELEMRLLNRCVYKNWNARRVEFGMQACRRTVRLLERMFAERREQIHLEKILAEFKPDDIEIRLPSRGILNQLLAILEQSSRILSKIACTSKTSVDRLRLECSRANYVHYNILMMALCSRIYFLVLTLDKVQRQFCSNVKMLIKSFKKKTKI